MNELRERVTAALAPLGPDADQFVQAVMEAIEGDSE